MKNFIILLFILGLNISCIPNKDLIYLQKENKQKSGIEVAEEVAKPYRLQVNDVLQIKVKALDQKYADLFNLSEGNNQNQNAGVQNLYFNGYSVDEHGNIRMPILGNVNVLGYTLDELRLDIEKKLLTEYFRTQANVYVDVKLAGLRYTINGEINSPGTNVLYQDKATILEAIANSGEITLTGNRKEVKIIRKYPYGYETHTIDLTKESAVKSPYFYIQSNDYIYIKPLQQKSWGTGITGVQTIATIVSALSLITTVLLLSKNL